MTNLIKQSSNVCQEVFKRTINMRSGSEGPAYDPYGYQEVIFSECYYDGKGLRNDVVVTFHGGGLLQWLEVNHNSKSYRFDGFDFPGTERFDEVDRLEYETLNNIFIDWTGMSLDEATKLYFKKFQPIEEDGYGCLADYE